MEIIKAHAIHIPAIKDLANETWYATYSSLVPLGQIAYMLDMFYNDAILQSQMKEPHQHFLVMLEEDILQGYAHCIEMEGKLKLSKLYFSTNLQGKGLGRMMMKAIEDLAKTLHYSLIELYVNRGNPAQHFYEKMGFNIVESVDMPLGEYWLNDYIMHKRIKGV